MQAKYTPDTVIPYEIMPALCNCFAPLRGLHRASISQGKLPYPSEVGTALHGSSRASERHELLKWLYRIFS